MHSSFQDFAKIKGIYLLKDDIAFIKDCLAKIPYNERRGALETYSTIWLSHMGKSDIVYHRQNLGRRNANKYLRDLVYV